jgi:hypothetical protein
MGLAVKRLIAARMAGVAIPIGVEDPFMAGVCAITTPERIQRHARDATAWVRHAIAVMKTVPDNPFRDDDDEAIATALLEQITIRRRCGSSRS